MELDIRQIMMLHPILRIILLDVEENCGPLRITSLRRTTPGVHNTNPLRAVDISCKAEQPGKGIEAYINEKWEYDKQRPELKVCLWHGEVKHLHIQVHYNTKRKPLRMERLIELKQRQLKGK